MKHAAVRFALIFALLAPLSARAQMGLVGTLDAAHLYTSGVSYPTTVTSPTATVYGPDIGLYGQIALPYVKPGVVIRGQFNGGSSSHFYSALVGLRVAVDLKVRLVPYLEGFFAGYGNFLTPSKSKGEGGVGPWFAAGADFKLLPHLDWRVFDFCHLIGPSDLNANSFSTGIVFRFL